MPQNIGSHEDLHTSLVATPVRNEDGSYSLPEETQDKARRTLARAVLNGTLTQEAAEAIVEMLGL